MVVYYQRCWEDGRAAWGHMLCPCCSSNSRILDNGHDVNGQVPEECNDMAKSKSEMVVNYIKTIG